MLPHRATMPATALALILAAQSAQAELTPTDVWGNWRSYFGGFGNEISATETLTGNTLTVSDVIVTPNIPEEEGGGTVQVGTLTFTGNDDGTVSVSFAEVMPVTMTAISETEEINYTIDFVNSGLSLIASGDPTQITYTYTADSMGMVLKEAIIDGEVIPPENAAFEFSAINVNGQTEVASAAQQTYEQSFSASTLTYTAAAKDIENGGAFNLTASASGVQYDGAGVVPTESVDSNDLSDMLGAGFNLEGTFSFGAGQSVTETSGPDGAFAANTQSQGGTIAVKMAGAGITYDVMQAGLAVDITSDQIPFPASFMLDNSAFTLTMPLVQSDDAQDFGIGLTLAGFSMSDMLWSIFDPTEQLPRDPATIALALSGKGRLLFDFLDPAAASVSGNPNITPAEVESVDIDTLQVSVAGAELTGTGAFTFTNPPGGMPQPNGAVDLKLSGGNGLIDKLVAIGLLPEEQAMGARMMMGLFAVPGSEPDTLTSKIEVNEQGHVIANGQRIQ